MDHLIVIDPAVCNGHPVVKGTRITVQNVMEFLAAGDSVDKWRMKVHHYQFVKSAKSVVNSVEFLSDSLRPAHRRKSS